MDSHTENEALRLHLTFEMSIIILNVCKLVRHASLSSLHMLNQEVRDTNLPRRSAPKKGKGKDTEDQPVVVIERAGPSRAQERQVRRAPSDVLENFRYPLATQSVGATTFWRIKLIVDRNQGGAGVSEAGDSDMSVTEEVPQGSQPSAGGGAASPAGLGISFGPQPSAGSGPVSAVGAGDQPSAGRFQSLGSGVPLVDSSSRL